MRSVSEEGKALCRWQGRVFEESLTGSSSSSAVFIRRYMNSAAAARLDRCALATQTQTAAQMVDEVEREYGGRPYGRERFAAEELYWIGYIYRYWALALGMSSRKIGRIIGANELRGLYLPYHTMDAEQAVERIMEAKGADAAERDEIEQGVALLRQARAETAQRKKRS